MIRFFLIFFSLLISVRYVAAQKTYEEELTEWQHELNDEFADPKTSPLPDHERHKFKSLDFFPIDAKYRMVASFQRTPDEPPFTMPTTGERKPVYVKYGIATFSLEGQTFSLPIYQNIQLSQTEEYKDYLFAPFTDQTNGFETYGGGRYIDLRIPENETEIILDFNKAYNPYCAYNSKYSCPIPPPENDLNLKITAGVKAWDKY